MKASIRRRSFPLLLSIAQIVYHLLQALAPFLSSQSLSCIGWQPAETGQVSPGVSWDEPPVFGSAYDDQEEEEHKLKSEECISRDTAPMGR